MGTEESVLRILSILEQGSEDPVFWIVRKSKSEKIQIQDTEEEVIKILRSSGYSGNKIQGSEEPALRILRYGGASPPDSLVILKQRLRSQFSEY